MTTLRSRPLWPLFLGLLLVPLVLALNRPGNAAVEKPIAKHAKVRVVKGKFAGRLGAVVAVSNRPSARRRYKVRLGGGAVARFRRGQLRGLPLAVGDRVRVVAGRRKGRLGRITRIHPRRSGGRRIRRTYVVDLVPGPKRRFARKRLAYVPPRPGPPGTPSCQPGATSVTSPSRLRSEVAAGRNVCVRVNLGDVDLSQLRPPHRVYVGTHGGSIGEVSLIESARITLRARFRATVIRYSRFITIEHSIVGGSRGRRVLSNLISMPCCSDDVTIRDSDIGWTTSDDSGNTGYGIRIQGNEADEGSDRARVERNRIHHIGADGLQGMGNGVDAVIDRNEFAFIAAPPGSDEHSDDLQIIDNGPNLRVTNNFLHDNGMLDPGVKAPSESGPYIHAGDDDPMLFENNLVRDEWNFMAVGSLGTGGCSRSNFRFRRNTFFHNGLSYSGKPDFAWKLCDGSNNLYERNLVVATLAEDHPFSASATTRRNLTGHYSLDSRGNCVSAACNTASGPIGYRKPSGVHW